MCRSLVLACRTVPVEQSLLPFAVDCIGSISSLMSWCPLRAPGCVRMDKQMWGVVRMVVMCRSDWPGAGTKTSKSRGWRAA